MATCARCSEHPSGLMPYGARPPSGHVTASAYLRLPAPLTAFLRAGRTAAAAYARARAAFLPSPPALGAGAAFSASITSAELVPAVEEGKQPLNTLVKHRMCRGDSDLCSPSSIHALYRTVNTADATISHYNSMAPFFW